MVYPTSTREEALARELSVMKRRKREFAIYLTLGMSKGTISLLLLLETLLIGMGSLAAGLIAGVGLSQLMSALVAKLFEADMSAYRFTVSGEAIVKTILYYAVMYLVVVLILTRLLNLLERRLRRSDRQ